MQVISTGAIRKNLIIELTPTEQDVLFAIMARVSGCPKNSPRRVTEEMLNILIKYDSNADSREYTLASGQISFRDYN